MSGAAERGEQRSAADYDQLVEDLASQEESLAAIVDLDLLREETAAEGWTVEDTVAHLLSTDRSALLSLRDPETFIARREARRLGQPLDPGLPLPRGTALVDSWQLERLALLDALREQDPAGRVEWHGPSMSARSFATARLMEYWAHGEDIALAGRTALPSTDRIRHVCHLGAITREFSFRVHGEEAPEGPVLVDLVLPSGAPWVHGDPAATERVSGLARDFCLVVTQRRHVEDTGLVLEGAHATRWMHLAQAFAGAPSVTAAARRGLPT